jgi:putative colanic acid biosynthesis glycosyltransferase WcaI
LPFTGSSDSDLSHEMKFLILNQAFHPDVVATSQHASDLARELVARGHSVTVISSSRAYDDPSRRFASRERWHGIEIVRTPSTGFGKKAIWRRFLDFGTYMVSCLFRLAFIPRQDVVIALTSPPLICLLGALFTRLKGGHFAFWVMDLNPDEAIAAGALQKGSFIAGISERMLKYSLKRTSLVITLDRFMQQRVLKRGIDPGKVRVIPPWSHDDAVRFDAPGREAFRAEHGLQGKFVVMYSGNHSPCHPLDPLLRAAEGLASDDNIRFCFVGGGSEFVRVQEFARGLTNVVCLPYQPLDRLGASLSSADLHVIVMGSPFVGIVHPCKIYNVLALGSPFLYIGPPESHIGDILEQFPRLKASTADPSDPHQVADRIIEASRASTAAWKPQPDSVKQFGRERILGVLLAELEALGQPTCACPVVHMDQR